MKQEIPTPVAVIIILVVVIVALGIGYWSWQRSSGAGAWDIPASARPEVKNPSEAETVDKYGLPKNLVPGGAPPGVAGKGGR